MRTLLETTGRSPEIVVALVMACAGALWAVHAGPFPGTALVLRHPFAGNAALVAVWLALYATSGRLLLSHSRRTPRRLLGRTALGLVLIVAACAPLALADRLTVLGLPFVKAPWTLAAVVLSVCLVCRQEAASMLSRARAGRVSRLLLWCLAASCVAAVTVAAVAFLMNVAGGSPIEGVQLSRAGFAVSTVLLAGLFLVGGGLCGRLAPSMLVGATLYTGLGLANAAKMKYMHASVQPLDLMYVSEFMPQFTSTFGVAAAAAAIAGGVLLALAVALVWRRPGRPLEWPHRTAAGVAGLTVLLVAAGSQQVPSVRDALATFGLELKPWESVASARRNGVLLEFLADLPDTLVAHPDHYSRRNVLETAARYAGGGVVDDDRGDVTMIVYMIESLMEPGDLGLALTADPIPTLHRLAREHASGWAIVPGRFGESASSEFELLTGMSTSFLPERSVAYKQYVKRSLPSLPCLLRKHGFRTGAVQADPIGFYNRAEVYGHLCFDEAVWLNEAADVPRAANGTSPADDAIVDAVIAMAARGGSQFIFAFPSSTHHPYGIDAFADSDLDLADPAVTAARQELKYYLNTLRVADRAVQRLIDHFADRPGDVLIAIVGDHLPPLSVAALEGFYAHIPAGTPQIERQLLERRVPLIVWSNYLSRPPEELMLSLNLLGAHLLERAGIGSEGFLRFVEQLSAELPVVSRDLVGRGPQLWGHEGVPGAYSHWLVDYRLLQYDMLFGEAYLQQFERRESATPL